MRLVEKCMFEGFEAKAHVVEVVGLYRTKEILNKALIFSVDAALWLVFHTKSSWFSLFNSGHHAHWILGLSGKRISKQSNIWEVLHKFNL